MPSSPRQVLCFLHYHCLILKIDGLKQIEMNSQKNKNMEISQLLKQMQRINQAMHHPNPKMLEDMISDRERTLAKAVKIGEETGELHLAVLGMLALQAKRKGRKIPEVEKEIIDVILATLSLALHLGIDVERVLEKRLVEINKRFNI